MFLSLSSITWYRQKCGINRHTTRCTSPVSMVSQLLSGCRNGDQHQHNMLVCAHMALEGLYIFSFGRKNVPKCKSEGQKMKWCIRIDNVWWVLLTCVTVGFNMCEWRCLKWHILRWYKFICSNRTKATCESDLTQSQNVLLVITTLHVITNLLLMRCSQSWTLHQLSL